jgi:DNA-binding transcriptional ArsR family regulator
MPIELPVLQELCMDLRPPNVGDGVAMAALIADPTRAGILAMLRSGPHCVCELAAAFDERQNNVSNHLARLRDTGLVRVSRGPADGRRVYYERDEAACAAAAARVAEILG